MLQSKSSRFQRAPHGGRGAARRGGRESVARMALEDQIRQKLASYGAIRHLDLEWSSAVRGGKAEYSREKAKRFQSLYEDWMKDAQALVRIIRESEGRGVPVSGSLELRDAVGFCPAGIDVDATREAFDRLDRGEGLPISEASDGKILRRRTS